MKLAKTDGIFEVLASDWFKRICVRANWLRRSLQSVCWGIRWSREFAGQRTWFETKSLGPVVGCHLANRGLENGRLQRAFRFPQGLCQHIAQRHLLLHCSLLSGGRAPVEGTTHGLSSVGFDHSRSCQPSCRGHCKTRPGINEVLLT